MAKKSKIRPCSFAVIGAGPVGCTVAAFLAKGGYEVTLCDVLPELIEPVVRRGIIVEGAVSLHQKVTRAITSIDVLAQNIPDVIILTVKAHALPLISSVIESFYQEGLYVVSWQNGIDTELILAQVLGKKPVMRAVVNYGCELLGPGHVNMPFHHPPHYLQELDPHSRPVAKSIAHVLTECGLITDHTDQIAPMVWRKSVVNACSNAVSAITGRTVAQTLNDPIVFRVVNALIKECVNVARANEIFLGSDFYPFCMEYMKMAGGHKPSMLVDLEMKRKTEIDFLNGKIVEYGERVGFETPYNLTITSLIKALEAK